MLGFSTQEPDNKVNISARAVTKGLIIAVLTSVILSFILGAIMYMTPLRENLTSLLTLIILGVSSFSGGCTASRVTGSSGLLHGLITGTLFFIVAMLIFSILLTGNWNAITLIKKALVTFLSASAGGILGVATDR